MVFCTKLIGNFFFPIRNGDVQMEHKSEGNGDLKKIRAQGDGR